MTTLNRRQFIIGTAGAGLGLSLLPLAKHAVAAPATGNEPILMVVFLRGGMDGLALVGPSDDANYIAARPANLRVAADGETPGTALAGGPAGHDWRIHPNAAPLAELYQQKQLAIVHACGLKDGSRSHFEAMDLMESGAANGKSAKSHEGWLTRFVTELPLGGVLPVVSLGSSTPKSLLGFPSAVSMQSVDRFSLGGRNRAGDSIETALRAMYPGAGPSPGPSPASWGGETDTLVGAGAMTLQKLDEVSARLPQRTPGQPFQYTPQNGATYPTGGQGNDITVQLQSAATLMRLDLGVRVVTLNVGGWDTHQNQAPRLNQLFTGLGRGLHAFWTDLGPSLQARTTIVVMSEFGRRIDANNSNGTDHGHGNLMLVLGQGIKGGTIHGQWPGLGVDARDNGVDLAITTDYRAVLGEVLATRAGCANVGTVFEGLMAGQYAGVC